MGTQCQLIAWKLVSVHVSVTPARERPRARPTIQSLICPAEQKTDIQATDFEVWHCHPQRIHSRAVQLSKKYIKTLIML